jgi:phosphoenolpyruvate synthase/pyruvate phosphate dikinase
MNGEKVVRPQDDTGIDPAQVGVKHARLSALSREGIRVPAGFVVTASAYQEFVLAAALGAVIAREIRGYRAGRDVVTVSAAIRTAFCEASLPPALTDRILEAYEELGGDGTEVAVRCSPTAPQDDERDEVFLHLTSGPEVLAACRQCFASLFDSVAVGHRELRGPDHLAAVMPVVVQRMVRSDLGGSGTARGESTFVRIRAAWGLGESVVGDPDQYSVHPGARPLIVKHRGTKPTRTVYADPHGTRTIPTTPEERSALVLTDDDLQELARWSVVADQHFRRSMELEWAKDGSGVLYLVEVREPALPTVPMARPAGDDRVPQH